MQASCNSLRRSCLSVPTASSHRCWGGWGQPRGFGIKAAVSSTAVPCASSGVPHSLGGSSGGSEPCKRLVLLRHAESESRASVRDHDRPLSADGKLQAGDIARLLAEAGWIPDLVLASNAKRTRETLDEMCAVISQLADADSHFYGSLYTVAALDGQTRAHLEACLLEVVDDARHHCVLLVGHNKGWEEAASSFAGHAIKLKTASAALLKVNCSSWAEVLKDDAQWQLVDVLTPASAT